jgi:hypothetical protein
MKRALMAPVLAVVLMLPATQASAQAAAAASAVVGSTTSPEIAKTTLSALPSCVRWRIRGVCFWLRCTIFGCEVKTTVRVSHFTPDVTVSTWHDNATHPWSDYGRKLSTALQPASTGLMKAISGGILGADSSGTRSPSPQSGVGPQRGFKNLQLRGADAIGNPFNFVTYMLGGSGAGGSPDSVAVPNVTELMKFFGEFPSQVAQQISEIPAGYTTGQLNYANSQIASMGAVVDAAKSAMSAYESVSSGLTGGDGAIPMTGVMDSTDTSILGGGGDGTSYICPPGVSPFGLLFHSELDSWFWRGLIPLESVYPATWLPGFKEVGQGLLQTWGSEFPRQGALFQQHPAKTSAVLAQRVGSIVTRGAQPHIYARLQTRPPGYRYFGSQEIVANDDKQTRWQRVFPLPSTTCQRFGVDDSTALVGFGDGITPMAQGFIWNAWRRQECCQQPGGTIFIGSIAF